MALKPFYNKKGHLGMTRQQVKAALAGGATLPEMSGDDKGKVLVIDSEGKLAVQEDFLFNVTYDGVYTTTTVTPNQLTAAVQAGKKIVCVINSGDQIAVSNLIYDANYEIIIPAPIFFSNPDIYPGGIIYVSTTFNTEDLDSPFYLAMYTIAHN